MSLVSLVKCVNHLIENKLFTEIEWTSRLKIFQNAVSTTNTTSLPSTLNFCNLLLQKRN